MAGDNQIAGSIFPGASPDCHNYEPDCRGLFWRHNYRRPKKIKTITDGTSKTIMVGEDIPIHDQRTSAAFFSNGDHAFSFVPLNYKPEPPTPAYQNNMGFRSNHPGIVQFAFCDGSTRAVEETIDHNLYRALSTRAGGEVIPETY
jgi:hypothetical protein